MPASSACLISARLGPRPASSCIATAGPEGHAAQADLRDFEAGAAEFDVFHEIAP